MAASVCNGVRGHLFHGRFFVVVGKFGNNRDSAARLAPPRGQSSLVGSRHDEGRGRWCLQRRQVGLKRISVR